MNYRNRKTQRTNPSLLSISLVLFWNATLWSLLLYQKMKNESSVPDSLSHETGQSPRARMLHVPTPTLTHLQHFQSTEQNVVPSRSCFFLRSTHLPSFPSTAAKDTQLYPRHPFHVSKFLTSQQVTSLFDVHHLSRQAVFKLSNESLIISPRTNPVSI